MMHKLFTLGLAVAFASVGLKAQVLADSLPTPQSPQAELPVDSLPEINYARPIHKVIADIRIVGAKSYDPEVLLNLSGLAVGEEVTIPGVAFTNAVERFMRHGLFSNAQILVTKYQGNKAWIEIRLTERPRIYEAKFVGIKKSDREELEKRTNLRKGLQMTPNVADRTKQLIRKYYAEKGYRDMDVEIRQEDNLSEEGFVNLTIRIDRKDKTSVNEISIEGNTALSDDQIRMAMKKTNERFRLTDGRLWYSIRKIFSSKKLVDKEYREDLDRIIERYQELGYRDVEILSDTIMPSGKKNRVDIRIKLNEGRKYYIDDIRFVGNTKFETKNLEKMLGMKRGDVYNQKKLNARIFTEEDALSMLYYNNGYMFAHVDPVETKVDGDSVSLDIRIVEGMQATINKVSIKGNNIVYDEVIRRELFTKPGAVFSRDDVLNSLRMIAQLGHFDPEKMIPNTIPNPASGTVDLEYNLSPKSNDQFELSAGWSQTGVIFRTGLRFSNFAMSNIFRPSMYKNFVPQGQGQTFSINMQTNGKFYQSYGISFMDPWFGGKRPNLLSVSAFYSKMTAIDTKYYNNRISSYYNPYYNGFYNPIYGGSSYGMGGYDNMGGGYNIGGELYEKAQDPDKSLQMFGLSVGYGKRLSWPDNWFQIYASLNYTHYRLRNWVYETFQNFHEGYSNDVNMELRLQRNSIDNPIYTRSGSEFTISVKATPPYSLWDGNDYSNPKLSMADRYRFVEYHKWMYRNRIFLPLLNPATVKRTPVLMGRVETGLIGYYNSHKRSPFGTYYMGGDGMSSYMGGYMNETIGLRGYKNGSIAGSNYNYAYAYMRMSMELRYPLMLEGQTNIWVLGFLEAGNAWSNFSDYDPFNLKRSAGVGFRITLPMLGILGIDWGYGFDRPNGMSDRGGSNIHFVLGQEF
ncbi:Outer membrane protein omp85 precursor [Porphyromonas crevioricanis]|uniref:Outer membrane protein omp85 n=2 Tax=Porphyromonas crevioricanis TaxID=393921 RepID=A0A2X4PKC2_9PORP|nr:POTRA domain-containing protein [Porphyromonas crevioricanis]SJZ68430.1 Beta-barrel assembly machine subunit BamA [Porphyromonas crevioricanis]SQH72223.1 Outer membrane protein omp85 precursor [Porphyromonas crevioricanis]